MCGISGFHSHIPQPSLLRDMTQSLQHRGPDETHLLEWELGGVGLNRLSITARDQKNPPLWSEDRRYCFVFNGEIYNYKKIRQELKSHGTLFQTENDGEVLFQLFLQKGEAGLSQCQGMFAFAIWDSLQKNWILGRDPLGIKPLYYCRTPQGVFFSSEIVSLLPVSSGQIQHSLVPQYLQRRFVTGDQTLFQGIRKVLPGHLYRSDKDQQTRYWFPQKENLSFAEELEESFLQSSDTDLPATVLFSGGLDSSVLLWELHRLGRNVRPLFFENAYDTQERKAAESLCQHLGISMEVVEHDPQSYQLLPQILRHLQEPLGDAVIVPTYQMMKAARQWGKVVYSGEGADELLAGYGHHTFFHRHNQLRAWGLNPALKTLIRHRLFQSLLQKFSPYPAQLSPAEWSKISQSLSYKNWQEFFELFALFSARELQAIQPGYNVSPAQEESTMNLRVLLWKDLSEWLPDYNLLRLDRLSMSQSLELRVPYLNERVVRSTLPLREKDLFFGKHRKVPLQDYALSRGMPAALAKRKKHPLTLKEQKAYGSDYREFALQHMDESFCQTFGWNRKALLQLWNSDDFLAQKQQTAMLHLSLWWREFFSHRVEKPSFLL